MHSSEVSQISFQEIIRACIGPEINLLPECKWGKNRKKNDLVKIDLSSVFGAANIFENTGAGKFSKNSKLFLCCSKFRENCIGFGIVQCFG
jgi:hypothetical protein